jgi:hypothetical protein
MLQRLVVLRISLLSRQFFTMAGISLYLGERIQEFCLMILNISMENRRNSR